MPIVLALSFVTLLGSSQGALAQRTPPPLPLRGPPPELTTVAFTTYPSTVVVDSNVQFEVQVSDPGTWASYSYTWLPAGCSSQNSSTWSCNPLAVGSYPVVVWVNDSSGAGTQSAVLSPSLQVLRPLNVTALKVTPSRLIVGASMNITVSVSGGIAPYFYNWQNLPNGCNDLSNAVPPFSCSPSSDGNYSIGVQVSDSETQSASRNAVPVLVSVLPPPTLVLTSVRLSSTTVLVGTPVTFTATVAGGEPPYYYNWQGLPNGCNANGVPSFTCTPTSPGLLSVSLSVTDSENPSQSAESATIDLAVKASPLNVSVPIISPTKVSAGDQVQFSVDVSGGTQQYNYAWSDLPAGCSGGQSQFNCNPTQAGTYNVSVKVTDSGSPVQSNSSLPVLLTVSPALTATNLKVSPTNAAEGSPVNISMVVSGGVPPYRFQWQNLPQGCNSMSNAPPPFTCTPTQTGTYSISGQVYDSVSQQQSVYSSPVVLTVVPAPLSVTDLVATPSSVAENQNVVISVDVAGGTQPYQETWQGLPPGCTNSGGQQFQCQPTQAGTYRISVVVTDGSTPPLEKTSNTVTLNVTAGSGSLLLSLLLFFSIVSAPAPLLTVVLLVMTVVFTYLTARRSRAIVRQLGTAGTTAPGAPTTRWGAFRARRKPSPAPSPEAEEKAKPAETASMVASASLGPKCSACGAENLAKAKFCSDCGKPMEAPPA